MTHLRVGDMFSGIGGFHYAISQCRFPTEVVWACEIDDNLRAVYQENFGILPDKDIREVPASTIPDIDLLTAGFPCQPFSTVTQGKRGKDHESADLFQEIIRVVQHKLPNYVLLENVPALLSGDNAKVLGHILQSLIELNYNVTYEIYCPTDFGVPHHRPRVYIMAQQASVGNMTVLTQQHGIPLIPLRAYLSMHLRGEKPNRRPVNESLTNAIAIWKGFYETCQKNEIPLPPHPVYLEEFGANYQPYRDMVSNFEDNIKGSYGAFGNLITEMSDLPRRVQNRKALRDKALTDINANRGFYNSYFDIRTWFYEWESKMDSTSRTNTTAKFSPRVRASTHRDFEDLILNPRASGLDFYDDTLSPALTTNPSNTPIMLDTISHLSNQEMAILQGMLNLKKVPEGNVGVKGFGNAVNAVVVQAILECLITGKSVWAHQRLAV